MGDRTTKGFALPTWHRLGGESIIPGGSSAAATLPPGTEIVHIAAENGDIYYNFGALAGTTAPGFVAQGGRVIEGPLRDLNALAFFSSGGTVHVQYYQENRGK